MLILLLWASLSVPAALLIHYFVEPNFEASSLLEIDPLQDNIFGPLARETGEDRNVPFLQTQVSLITSNGVLEEALNSPEIAILPTVKKWEDPQYDLRKKLKVFVVPDTNLIRISMELQVRDEAVKIVHAVSDAYIKYTLEASRAKTRSQTASYEQQVEKIHNDIDKKQKELKALVKKGNVKLTSADLLNSKSESDPAQPTFKSLPEDHLQRMISETYQTDLEIFEAQSLLEAKQAANQATQEAAEHQGRESKRDLVARIEAEFLKEPAVAELADEIEKVQNHLDHNKSLARQANEPSTRAATKQLQKLNERYVMLWKSKYEEIGERLRLASGAVHSLASIKELELKIAMLMKRKERQTSLLEKVEFKQKGSSEDTFDAAYLNYQLSSLFQVEEQVRKNLEQLRYEAVHERFRVIKREEASAAKLASSNKKLKYMAAAPVGILFAMLGLFLLLEIKDQRVADPDSLQTRVRSEVFALPPLPNPYAMRRLKESVVDSQREQFSQRLDHLRFAVCGNTAELGRGRCVMLTSAIGGEGKTTVAAQLAARCGNAGVHTLLIDSDFRRSSLCHLLQVPDGPGLTDLLSNKTTFDQVVMPVQGGEFYLLSAGSPVDDTIRSRMLQGPNFGQLIKQLRQLYDLIIIDSPPVLPVPDALIMGKWADGAILAARYDKSRFPQVERARRTLDNAGIPVLGTVINGMKDTNSYYGSYEHNRRPTSESETSNAV